VVGVEATVIVVLGVAAVARAVYHRGPIRQTSSGPGRTKRQNNDYRLCVLHKLPPIISCPVTRLWLHPASDC
jgi:hypothetical protein